MPNSVSGLTRSPPIAVTTSQEPIAAPAIHATSLIAQPTPSGGRSPQATPRRGSFPVGRFDQLVEPDDDPQDQARNQEPWRGSPPAIGRVPKCGEQENGPDERITGRHRGRRSRDVLLQRLGRPLERRLRFVACHSHGPLRRPAYRRPVYSAFVKTFTS